MSDIEVEELSCTETELLEGSDVENVLIEENPDDYYVKNSIRKDINDIEFDKIEIDERANNYCKCSSSASGKKTIMNDLDKLEVPDDVKAKAEMIYNLTTNKKSRGGIRKGVVAACIFHAYIELGEAKDIQYIAKILGVKKNLVKKALNNFDEKEKEYKSIDVFHYPHEFTRHYLREMEMSFNSDEINKHINEMLQKDSELLEFLPQNVSAAGIVHYSEIYGYPIKDKKTLLAKIGKTTMNISKPLNLMKKVYTE